MKKLFLQVLEKILLAYLLLNAGYAVLEEMSSFTLFQAGNYFHCKASRPHGGSCKHRLRGHQQKPQHPKQCSSVQTVPFNSYNHSHGIVTASALLELRPTLRW